MRTGRATTVALLLLALPQVAVTLPLISEVFYDASGSDDGQGFVELYGAPGTVLDGLAIQGVNGSDGAITHDLVLVGAIPGDGIFVVADGFSDGTTAVADADLILNFDFQNGPDSVQLVAADGSIVDALGYGVFDLGEIFAGEGSPAPDASAGSALVRLFADLDSDDNAVDFAVAARPLERSRSCPDPRCRARRSRPSTSGSAERRSRRPRTAAAAASIPATPGPWGTGTTCRRWRWAFVLPMDCRWFGSSPALL